MHATSTHRRYRPKDVAERYEFALASVYRWIKSGEIDSARIGGSIFIPADEIARLDKIHARLVA